MNGIQQTHPGMVVSQRHINPFSYMFFSPAGVGCTIYMSPVAPKSWRAHFNNKHPELYFPMQSEGFVNKLFTHITAAEHANDRLSFAVTQQEHNKHCCTQCNKVFSSKVCHTRHLKNKSTPKDDETGGGTCSDNNHLMLKCYKSKCGRYFPINQGKLCQRVQDLIVVNEGTSGGVHRGSWVCVFFGLMSGLL